MLLIVKKQQFEFLQAISVSLLGQKLNLLRSLLLAWLYSCVKEAKARSH
jgi:hypothetical protein